MTCGGGYDDGRCCAAPGEARRRAGQTTVRRRSTLSAWVSGVSHRDGAFGIVVGCERQLEKAVRRLAPFAPEHRGVDLAGLLPQLAAAREVVALDSLQLPPVRV